MPGFLHFAATRKRVGRAIKVTKQFRPRARRLPTYLPLPASASVILSRAEDVVMTYLFIALTFYIFGFLTCVAGVAVLVKAAEDDALHNLENQ